MNKIMIVAGCLLGLALACIPAYASPTNKKITLSCNITAGTDMITGTAMVTLCDSALCDGQTFSCDPVDCDSSGVTAPISITVACDSLTFKVAGFQEVIDAKDYAVDANTAGPGNIIGTGGSDVINALGGKGYKVQINTDPGFVTDSVALTIK
jgi:hypothetical protein